MMKKIVNGVEIDMTPEEIAEIEAWRTPTLEQIKEAKKIESATARYAAETSGLTANGRLFLTTREDVRILESAMDKIRRGMIEEVAWKCGDGKFIKLKANNIESIEAAILTHIQGCFDKEALIAEAIEACSSQEELSAIVITY